ncbi:MAG TPA: class I SAM-dependent methyltransferase [Propionibacteriaceae bacterium]
MADTFAPAGFDRLWTDYPWPDAPPVPDAPKSGRDSAGFDLLFAKIAELDKPNPVIMEIGAEFGGSTRKFLSLPGTYVVSVDPWPDGYGGGSFPELKPFLGRERGMFELFQTFNFDFRDRLATVREFSPAGPIVVHDAGVEVDLIYVDGDHRYDPVLRDLTIASSLFPNAVITGDDWLLESDHKKYEGIAFPVQTAVKRWAATNHVSVEVHGDTWAVDPSQPFNLDRPVPNFGARSLGMGKLTEQDLVGRLKAIEQSVQKLEKGQQETTGAVRDVKSTVDQLRRSAKTVETSLRNLPSRRLARKVRSVLPQPSSESRPGS